MKDLAWTIGGGTLLLGLVALGELAPDWATYSAILRLPLGLVYVLLVPGYLLQAAIFPRRGDLNGTERLGLSIGLSVALIPLLALLLDQLPWGLQLWSVVFGQAILGELLVMAVALRRLMLPPKEVYTPDLRFRPARWWRKLEVGERRLYLFAVCALLLAALAGAWSFLAPSEAEFMTEFYMLGPNGMAEYYPRQAAQGERVSVTLGVTNHEREAQEYRLEIWQVDPWEDDRRQLVGQAEAIMLQVGETRQWEQVWQAEWAGEDQQFEFLLFNKESPEPYRRLLLWMDIRE